MTTITSLSSSSSLSSKKPLSIADDFKLFMFLIWKFLGLPEPTRSQNAMADWLQAGSPRLLIEAFRGIGKSWVTAAYVCWLLYKNAQLRIMVVSASKSRADDFSTFVLRLLSEVPFLKHLQPQGDDRSSKISFDVNGAKPDQSPSVKSVGITGQLTGSRADVIIADDIEVPGNSGTQLMRDRLRELTKEFAAVLKPDPNPETEPDRMIPKIIYLGTPQTEQSIYNGLTERGYVIKIIPARYPTPVERLRYGSRLAEYVASDLDRDPSLAKKPVCTRFSEEVLLTKLAEYAAHGFALQFMLDTTLSDANRYPLRLRNLIVMDLDPKIAPMELAWGNANDCALNDLPNVGFDGDRLYGPFMVNKSGWQPYQGIVMAVDPSGRGGDETGWAVVSSLGGRLFLLDAGGLTGGYDDASLEALANKAKQWGVKLVIVEPNFGDGMFNKLLAPVMARIYPCAIQDTERSRGQKEQRIVDTLEPVIDGHRMVVNASLITEDYNSTNHLPPEHQSTYRLFYQLTRITRERGSLRKDDRLDALALAVHYWTSSMAKDVDKAAEQIRAAAMDAELRLFMQHVVGRAPGRTSISARPMGF